MATPDPEKIQRLQDALAEWEATGGNGELFNYEREEALAPVRRRALRLLDQRPRSEHELTERLVKAEFPAPLVDEVLASLRASSLLDDRRFAHEWVRQRAKRRGKSRSFLDRELREKGVSETDRRAALAQISDEDQHAIAEALAEKKAREVKTPPAGHAEYTRALRRVVGVLARRGFPQGMCMSIARTALDTRVESLRETS